MKTIAAVLACALASSAFAEDPAKTENKQRPALNLRLDDSTSAAPRITFGPPPSAVTKEEREKGLPEMGGKPKTAFDRPMDPNESGSPIPKAMEPGRNYDGGR